MLWISVILLYASLSTTADKAALSHNTKSSNNLRGLAKNNSSGSHGILNGSHNLIFSFDSINDTFSFETAAGTHVDTLQSFCLHLDISPSYCSCDKTPLVCQLNNFQEAIKENGTKETPFDRSNKFTLTYATIAAAFSLLGMVGNGAVICLAYWNRGKLTPCKLHIAELAVINFIFSAVQIVNIVPLYWTNIWIYGKVMCKLMKGILEVGSLLSSGFFQLISLERYFYIVYTYSVDKVKQFCQRFKHALLALNMFIVLVTVSPYIHGLDIEPNSQRCANFVDQSKWMRTPYIWFVFIVYSILPIGITSVLAFKLTGHIAKDASMSSTHFNRSDVNERILRNMLLIVFMFIVCTLPSRLITIIIDMVDFKSRGILLTFQFLSYTLYSLQGTLNPILYNMLAKEWRNNMTQMIQATFSRKKERAFLTLTVCAQLEKME